MSATDAMGRITRYRYYGDNLPLDTRRVRALGQNGQQDDVLMIDTRTYDAAGHVTTVVTPGPNTAGATVSTTYTYDAAGNVVYPGAGPDRVEPGHQQHLQPRQQCGVTPPRPARHPRGVPRRSATPTTWPAEKLTESTVDTTLDDRAHQHPGT